jgi:hypothetical protein
VVQQLNPAHFRKNRSVLKTLTCGGNLCDAARKHMSESFAALFEESLQRSEMRIGEVITAEVVRIEHNFVVVNAGLKSEAYVPSKNSRTTRANSKSR